MEELKIVMEALQGLGEDAKTAFIIWILIKYALHYIVTSSVIIGCVIVSYKILCPLVKNMHFISQIKNTMKFYNEYMSSNQKAMVLTILNDYKAKNNVK